MKEVNWELIVHRLDTIVESQSETKDWIKEVNQKISKLDKIEEALDDLKDWKKEIDETMSVTDMNNMVEWKKKIEDIVSPSQLKEHINDIGKLKTFRTKATMIWVIIQAIILILYFLNEAFGIFK